jgi:hypothetical protein
MKVRYVVSLFAIATTAAIVACSGDDPAVVDLPDGGPSIDGDGSSPVNPTGDSGPVAPEDLDGGLITDDDGGLPSEEEPDGGEEEIDAGTSPDGGVLTCGPAIGSGAAITSSCVSVRSLALGGTIASGTYDLTSYTVLAAAKTCSAYTPQSFGGRLEVEAGGAAGSYLLKERYQRTGLIVKAPNKTFEATASGTTLNVVQQCGAAVADADWAFSAGVNKGGKAYVSYTRTVGTGTVRFIWTKP